MSLFEAINLRKSVRKFTDEEVPGEVIEKALDHALLAPNSSNLQTWDFYWVQTPEKKNKLIHYCLKQSAARSAKEFLVVTANPQLWKRSQPEIINMAKAVKAPQLVVDYYEKLIPFFYSPGFFSLLGWGKKIIARIIGHFKPMMNGPYTESDLQKVAVKSAALACQNFALSITAQGYATCMMEGFDERRVKKLLKLKRVTDVVMIIAIGKEKENSHWGPRFRIAKEKVVHKV